MVIDVHSQREKDGGSSGSSSLAPSADSHAQIEPEIGSRIQRLPGRIASILSLRKDAETIERERKINERYKHIRYEKLEDYPKGYPQFAAFVSSDINFSIYRGFATLRNRVLQRRQARLVHLEKALNELDKKHEREGEVSAWRNRSYEYDLGIDKERDELLNKIDKEIKEYGDLLLWERQILAIEKPRDRNSRSWFNYLWNTKAVAKDEADIMFFPEDLLALTTNGMETSVFEGFFEDMLNKFTNKSLQRLFAEPHMRDKSSNKFIHYYSKSRISLLVWIFDILVLSGFLAIPIVVLYNSNSGDAVKLTIVLVFALILSSALLCFTKAKKHEIFAIAAAYCAVYVFFLGNLKASSPTTASTTTQPTVKGG